MKKIKSTKSFKAAVDETFDVQELREEKKRQYEDLRKDFDSRHDGLCEYASEHPEVFNGGDGGRTSEGTTERVRYRMTSGETIHSPFLAVAQERDPPVPRSQFPVPRSHKFVCQRSHNP